MTEIQPALTPEQWEATVPMTLSEAWAAFISEGRCTGAPYTDSHHAAAAILLHRQAFGFTWEDVEMLRAEADARGDFGSMWSGLADRIAALLPPRAP